MDKQLIPDKSLWVKLVKYTKFQSIFCNNNIFSDKKQ